MYIKDYLNTRINYQTNYCESSDITFITKCTYYAEELKEMEVIAFYSGEPVESTTRHYIENPSTKAVYEL